MFTRAAAILRRRFAPMGLHVLVERAGQLLGTMVPNIRKTSDLVQEIAAASEELAATAEEMSSQAAQLQRTMGFFKLEAGARQTEGSEGGRSAGTCCKRGVRRIAVHPVLMMTKMK